MNTLFSIVGKYNYVHGYDDWMPQTYGFVGEIEMSEDGSFVGYCREPRWSLDRCTLTEYTLSDPHWTEKLVDREEFLLCGCKVKEVAYLKIAYVEFRADLTGTPALHVVCPLLFSGRWGTLYRHFFGDYVSVHEIGHSEARLEQIDCVEERRAAHARICASLGVPVDSVVDSAHLFPTFSELLGELKGEILKHYSVNLETLRLGGKQ